MHQSVVALVRASDKTEARHEGERVFEKLRQRSDYDSFCILSVSKYDSEEGLSILQVVFGQQTLEFNDHLAEVRSKIKDGILDDELMEDHMFRFHCWRIGASRGSATRVYDKDAEGVQDRAHLQNVIDDWPRLVECGQHVKSPHPLWVVAADSHN